MKHLSFVADGDTMDLVEELKGHLASRDAADVFRKSLALLKVAVDAGRDTGGVVTLRGANAAEGASIALRA